MSLQAMSKTEWSSILQHETEEHMSSIVQFHHYELYRRINRIPTTAYQFEWPAESIRMQISVLHHHRERFAEFVRRRAAL